MGRAHEDRGRTHGPVTQPEIYNPLREGIPPGGYATGPITVPDTTDVLQATCEAAIVAAGLLVGPITPASHATIVSGNTIDSNPAEGATVPAEARVALRVSTGP